MTSTPQFLAGEERTDGSWVFAIDRDRQGTFGSACGGVVSLSAWRPPGLPRPENAGQSRRQRPGALSAGAGFVTPTVLHNGRTLTTVSLDLADDGGRLCTGATVKFLASQTLAHRGR